MNTETLIKEYSEVIAVSGYEINAQNMLKNHLKKFTNNIKFDTMGNLIAHISYGRQKSKPAVMLAAHIDEIGYMVTKIEKGGFIRVNQIGGIDSRTMISQNVTIHGKQDIAGVIGCRPIHLTTAEERKKAPTNEELFIDTGMSEEDVKRTVAIGDIVSVDRQVLFLENKKMSGKAMDDRAGTVVLLETLKELNKLNLNLDLFIVSTVQEEVGVRGALTSAYTIKPDIGIAIDVTHGEMPGVAADEGFELGKGPVVCSGPSLHFKISKLLLDTAKSENITVQKEWTQGPTGTDARAIQITQSGIAAGLLSIPLRYMHTSVETLSISDVANTGKLLARALQKIDRKFVEDLIC